MKSFVISWVLTLIGSLPLSLARALGAMVGWVAYHLRARGAKITRENIDRCFSELPETERRTLAYQSVLETGKLAAEVCVVWARDQAWLERHTLSHEGVELAQAALAEGRGLLILAPHIGNWEVVGSHLPKLGPTTSLYQPPKQPGLEAIVRAARQRSGSRVVPTDRKGLSQVLKALKEGGISGVLPDQTPKDPNAGIFVPFFGIPAFTMTLAFKLISKTGCRVLFAYARRVPQGFELVFKAPPEGVYSADAEVALTALNQGVEACVRDIPAQYQWEYRRFRKQPQAASVATAAVQSAQHSEPSNSSQ